MDMTLERPREVSAVEAVYSEHGPRLYRSLLAYAGDSRIAEDAMAEAFAQSIRRGEALHDPERWIRRAAYRIAAGVLKERSRTTQRRFREWSVGQAHDHHGHQRGRAAGGEAVRGQGHPGPEVQGVPERDL